MTGFTRRHREGDWASGYIQHISYAMKIVLNFVHNSNMRLVHYHLALECFKKVLRVKSDHAIACLDPLGDHDARDRYLAR